MSCTHGALCYRQQTEFKSTKTQWWKISSWVNNALGSGQLSQCCMGLSLQGTGTHRRFTHADPAPGEAGSGRAGLGSSVVWAEQKKEGSVSLGWNETLESIKAGAPVIQECADSWVPSTGEGGTGR